MQAKDLIIDVVKFLNEDKEVFVDIFTRDENNCVIKKERFPVSCVFSHEVGVVKIYIEKSE